MGGRTRAASPTPRPSSSPTTGARLHQLEQFRCTYSITEQGEGVVECAPFLRVFAEQAGGAFVELGPLYQHGTKAKADPAKVDS